MIRINLVLFVMLMSVNIFGQDNSFGVSSGINISTFKIDGFGSLGFKPGYSANLFYERKIINHLDCRIGISNYDLGSKTGIITFSNQYGEVLRQENFTISHNYISIPLVLKPYIGDKIKGYLKAGFCFSYLLNYRSTMPDDNGDNRLSKIDISQIFGVGLEFSLNEQFRIGFETGSYFSYANFINTSYSRKIRAYMLDLIIKYNLK